MSIFSRVFILVLGALFSIASQAALITYTFTGITSGQLNENTFSNQALTVIIRGDTSNVTPSIFGTGTPAIELGLTNTITLGALFSGSIDDGGLYVFNNQAANVVGFGSDNHSDLINIGPDASLATYDLASSFGPIGDATPFFSQFVLVALQSGDLLTLRTLSDATFTAVTETASIPEPGTVALLGLALAGIAVSRRKNVRESANFLWK